MRKSKDIIKYNPYSNFHSENNKGSFLKKALKKKKKKGE